MGAAFREGRPAAAPMRKEHERITGEYLDWQLAETARNELDDDEVEMRFMAECSASGGCNELECEEILKINELESEAESDVVAAGPRSGRESEEEIKTIGELANAPPIVTTTVLREATGCYARPSSSSTTSTIP